MTPGRRGPGFQRAVALAHLGLVADAQQHQPGVGLVLDRGGRALHHHRVADLAGQPTASSAERDGAALRHGDAVGGEELLAGLLVERGGAARQRLLDQCAVPACVIPASLVACGSRL